MPYDLWKSSEPISPLYDLPDHSDSDDWDGDDSAEHDAWLRANGYTDDDDPSKYGYIGDLDSDLEN